MTKEDKINYWLKTADHDWSVANDLYEKGDFSELKKWLLQNLQS